MRIEKADDDVIHGQKCYRTDDSARDGIVGSNDRVLHRIGQRQQHDKIERIELRQLTLACKAKRDDQEEVDQNRPDDFFKDRDVRVKQIAPQGCIHVSSPGCRWEVLYRRREKTGVEWEETTPCALLLYETPVSVAIAKANPAGLKNHAGFRRRFQVAERVLIWVNTLHLRYHTPRGGDCDMPRGFEFVVP